MKNALFNLGYVKKALKQFFHVKPSNSVHQPTKYNKPEYGKKVQYVSAESTRAINEEFKQKLQQVAGNSSIQDEQ